MARDSKPLIPLLVCDKIDEQNVRRACNGAWMGFSVHHQFFAWQRDFSREAIVKRKVERFAGPIITGIFFVLGIIPILHLLLISAINFFDVGVLMMIPHIVQTTFVPLYLAILFLMCAIYRTVKIFALNDFVRKDAVSYPYDEEVSFEKVSNYHKKSFHNIARAFTPRALIAFDEAAFLCYAKKIPFSLYAFFEHLLNTPDVQSLLIRYELNPSDVILRYRGEFMHETIIEHNNALLWQVIARSYIDAAKNHDPKVSVFHIFEGCIEADPSFTNFFEQLGIRKTELYNGIQWFRCMNHLSHEMRIFRASALQRSTRDTGAAMTGMATPLLNSIGDDLTKLSQYGQMPITIGREQEIGSVIRAFESGTSVVLITGDIGVGKMSVIEGLAKCMVQGEVPHVLQDKRLVKIPIASIVSGSDVSHYQMSIESVISEASRAGNIILAFEGIEMLCDIPMRGSLGQSLSDILAELIEKTGLLCVATVSYEHYRSMISGTRFGAMATNVTVSEVSENLAIQILESRAFMIENQYEVYFTYRALEQCVVCAQRFLSDVRLPGSALQLMREVAVYAKSSRGKNSLVSVDDVAHIIGLKTHVPITSIQHDEKEKLLHIEELMHERIIGQHEAVNAIANALRRARVDSSERKRPIATFLLLGPTGVGKTQTAKTLAEVYFGGEDNMIRFDMSEYQDTRSIYRLIGEPNAQASGLLTEAIRAQPFSLVLLDEIEKADRGLINIFLSVMDDGRLTDSRGKVVDCTNTIILMTSNAGSSYIQNALIAQTSMMEIQRTLLDTELKNYFSAEFLNRFDGVIVFSPLTEEQIEEITHLMISKIRDRLYEDKGITLDISDKVVARIAQKGYSREFGARPLRRVIQSDIQDVLARALLELDITHGQTITIAENGSITLH